MMARRWASSSDSTSDSPTAQPTSQSDSPHGVKLPPRAQKLVILNARSARILPRPRPMVRKGGKDDINMDQLDAQLKKLLKFKRDVPYEVILQSITQLRPSTQLVSRKRYEQLYNDIIRAYTVPQLRDFVKQNDAQAPCSTWRKTILSRYILDRLWGLKPSMEIDESSDVIVENSMDLSLRDIFLIVARNGQLARSWTKSGAKIVVLPDHQQIVIRSTKDTFKWIQVSMMNALSNVVTKEFDLTPFTSIINIDELPLETIQRLSDTYIDRQGTRLVASALGRKFLNRAERFIWGSVGYSPRLVESYLHDTNEVNTKRGVLTQIINDDALGWIDRDKEWARWKLAKSKVRKSEVAKESVDIVNVFDELATKTWENEKDTTVKDAEASLAALNLELLQVKPTKQSLEVLKEDFATTITDSILKTFKSVKFSGLDTEAPPHVTVAATFGNILHQASDKSSLLKEFSSESKSVPKTTFLTDVANVLDQCRKLPQFKYETEEAEEYEGLLDEDMLGNPSEGISLAKPTDPSPTIRTLLDESKTPSEHLTELFEATAERESEITDEHSYYVQMKFLPSPFLHDGTSTAADNIVSAAQFKEFPPMEMWLEIDEDERAVNESVNVVFVLKEANTYVSLAHLNTDVKFSAAKTEFVLDPGSVYDAEGSDSLSELKKQRLTNVREYLGKSRLDFSGLVNISAPNQLYLAMSVPDSKTGEHKIVSVPYMYHSMVYRKQTDLKYKGHILQLATVEGGVVSGRRTEANLVLDLAEAQVFEGTEKEDEENYKMLRTFVEASMEFVRQLEVPSRGGRVFI